MLAGVLLHMVETARPVNAAVNAPWGHGAVHHMKDAVFVVANIKNVGIAELAEIVRLPSGSGIQQGLIQDDSPMRGEAGILSLRDRFATQHLGAEIILKRIVVVETARLHYCSILSQANCVIFITLLITMPVPSGKKG